MKRENITINQKLVNSSVIAELAVVFVLYNVDLLKSTSYCSLIDSLNNINFSGELDIYIYDNSLKQTVYDFSDKKNIIYYYFHNPENPGISSSYNSAARLAKSRKKRWMLVLDQDSILPSESLTKYMEGIIKWPNYPLYAPRIYANNVLLSPCKYSFHRGTHFKSIDEGVHQLNGKNVLNSGLLMDIEAFLSVEGYDERVWLYFSDFVFFNKLKSQHKYFVVLDVRLEHELSSSDYRDLNFALKRFNLYCEGARAASISERSFFDYALTVFFRAAKMTFRFNNFNFLLVWVNNFLR